MHCNTCLEILPFPPRLPRALVSLLILSLLLQTGYPLTITQPERIPLPTLAYTHWRGRPGRVRRQHRLPLPRGLWVLRHSVPRALARSMLLAVLLYANGWTLTPVANLLLLLPAAQCLTVSLALVAPHSVRTQAYSNGARNLQRLYQLTLVVLVLSTLTHLWHAIPARGLVFPLLMGGWVLRPDEATELSVTSRAENHYTVILRGAFTLVWEPRDSFERWMLILFLRQFHGVDDTRPLLSRAQVGAAFDLLPNQVWRWEREVHQHGWHILSDRFRRDLHSALPQPDWSRTILKVWVPAFWLSAWDVRERMIQLGVIADRDALTLESLHALAQHTGFAQVRDRLLERFDLQGGYLIAKEHWWLEKLLTLNERLLTRLERGERLTPQELIAIEPLRLNPSAKARDSVPPPLAAALKQTLFEPAPETPAAPICCTYCGSDDVAPKSKQPRLKTVLDEFGEKHLVAVLRHYCRNLACRYQTFTHLPSGLVPHSPYPVQVRLLAVEVYAVLLSTHRRTARMLEVKASTVYRWVASLSPAALCLAAYLGVVRTSGVIGIDDKWIKVCSPSAVRPHGHRPRAVWRYAYFAVDVYSADLLALELYPEHNDAAVRQFLLELKAKGLQPRVVVSDLDPAYGRMLPLVFPQAVHHECIFHAVQNALNQMTTVYGRHYLEKVPETAPLHEAVTQLFKAQTQKTVRERFAALMESRASSVTRTPEIACVFDSLEKHFPKLVNAIESPLIPRTNNTTELVIRRFDQHYQSMCGLDSFESAQVYLRLFELVYRLTPFMDDNPGDKRGRCPLEVAGYDLTALPIADFFINLKLPPLSVTAERLSQ
jgi:transposase-like protein